MRLQLAMNVADLDTAIDFYTRLFDTPPQRLRPGYANFAISEPPLKLVLFEGDGEPGSINHLGVETDSAEEVVAAERRLRDAGLATTPIDDTACCYATKTETWVSDPTGHRWEWYVRTGDSEQAGNVSLSGGQSCGCDATATSDDADGAATGACCTTAVATS